MRLTDRVAIVTGAARGIGREIAFTLAREGAKTAISDLDIEPLNEVAREIESSGVQALAIKTDVTNSTEVQQMVEATIQKFGKVDILVNNAGGSARERASLFHESTEDVWDGVIARNLKSTFIVTKAVINHMIERGSGRIVNFGSVVGIMGGAGVVDYSAAKAGIIGFTKALAREVNPYGINVNAVAPGIIETRAVDQLPKDMIDDLKSKLSINRLGQPEDIANAVLYLVSDEASYVTGHVLRVCGGGYIS
ncbi:SDR family NAD(P)-dependent oxidoreductase [Chloroflexota bacterium]